MLLQHVCSIIEMKKKLQIAIKALLICMKFKVHNCGVDCINF